LKMLFVVSIKIFLQVTLFKTSSSEADLNLILRTTYIAFLRDNLSLQFFRDQTTFLPS